MQARARETRPKPAPIRAEDRARLFVEFEEIQPGDIERWVIRLRKPDAQLCGATCVEIATSANKATAVKAAAGIAAALWSAGTPAQLVVRDRKTGRWGEERTYPDRTPRRRG